MELLSFSYDAAKLAPTPPPQLPPTPLLRNVDSKEIIMKFIEAREATTYDNLLLDGSISNADVRDGINRAG